MAISKRLQLLALAAVSLMGVIVAIPPAGATGTSRHAPMQLVTPPGPGVAQSATTVRSSNWSGYYTTGSTYTNVSASWVQPTVTCNSTKTYSAFWVGLDGVGDSTVERPERKRTACTAARATPAGTRCIRSTRSIFNSR